MTEKTQLFEEVIKTVQTLTHDQEVQIKHLAGLQLKLEEAKLKIFSEKIVAVFSNATITHELLQKALEAFQMELNRLKANA